MRILKRELGLKSKKEIKKGVGFLLVILATWGLIALAFNIEIKLRNPEGFLETLGFVLGWAGLIYFYVLDSLFYVRKVDEVGEYMEFKK